MAGARDIDDLPRNDANYTALTPLWFLERAALVHPSRLSVVHGSRRYTWLQTYQRCRRLASALSSRSIGAGDTVLLVSLYVFLYFCRLLTVAVSVILLTGLRAMVVIGEIVESVSGKWKVIAG